MMYSIKAYYRHAMWAVPKRLVDIYYIVYSWFYPLEEATDWRIMEHRRNKCFRTTVSGYNELFWMVGRKLKQSEFYFVRGKDQHCFDSSRKHTKNYKVRRYDILLYLPNNEVDRLWEMKKHIRVDIRA